MPTLNDRCLPFLMVLAFAFWSPTSQGAVTCGHHFAVGASYITYCDNGKAGTPVFVIHGVDRNAADYAGHLNYLSTRVIAPEFKSSGGGVYWPTSSWSSGYQSQGGDTLSSFYVLDRMIEQFAGVAVIGHSAGGQFVTRYAAGTRLQGLTFIAANPGSYMWLDSTRPVAGTCSGYNTYKYGLSGLNAYMSQGVAPDYSTRRVIYLLGTADTVIDSNLDTSCAANRQGANRYLRGVNFFAHLQTRYGPVHQLVRVVGVGHSGKRMLAAAGPYLGGE